MTTIQEFEKLFAHAEDMYNLLEKSLTDLDFGEPTNAREVEVYNFREKVKELLNKINDERI